MKRRDWFISLAVGLILGLLGIYLGFTTRVISPAIVRAEGEAGDALRLMLKSHTIWETLKGKVTTQWLSPGKDAQTYYSLIEIENPNRAYVNLLDQNGSSLLQWYGDGNVIYKINNRDKTYTVIPQPDPTPILSMIPADLGDIGETIYRHPLAMIIPSPAMDYVFPVGLAQRPGEYKLVSEAEAEPSGRKVWVIDYRNQNELGEITMMARYWVDQQTGLILQANIYSTAPERFGDLIEVSTFTSVEFDQPIGAARFTPSLSGMKMESQFPSDSP